MNSLSKVTKLKKDMFRMSDITCSDLHKNSNIAPKNGAEKGQELSCLTRYLTLLVFLHFR